VPENKAEVPASPVRVYSVLLGGAALLLSLLLEHEGEGEAVSSRGHDARSPGALVPRRF